jgi:hypothetical protein
MWRFSAAIHYCNDAGNVRQLLNKKKTADFYIHVTFVWITLASDGPLVSRFGKEGY